MNQKQQKFIEQYLCTCNATDAARAAGYSNRSAYSQGCRLLKNAEIGGAIIKRRGEMSKGTEIIVSELLSELRQITKSTNDVWARLKAYDMLLKASGGYVTELSLMQKMNPDDLDGIVEKLMTKIKADERN